MAAPIRCAPGLRVLIYPPRHSSPPLVRERRRLSEPPPRQRRLGPFHQLDQLPPVGSRPASSSRSSPHDSPAPAESGRDALPVWFPQPLQARFRIQQRDHQPVLELARARYGSIYGSMPIISTGSLSAATGSRPKPIGGGCACRLAPPRHRPMGLDARGLQRRNGRRPRSHRSSISRWPHRRFRWLESASFGHASVRGRAGPMHDPGDPRGAEGLALPGSFPIQPRDGSTVDP